MQSTEQNDTPSMLTLTEAADYLRIHVQTLYRLLRQGRVPGGRIGGSWRIRKVDLDHWLLTNSTDGESNEPTE